MTVLNKITSALFLPMLVASCSTVSPKTSPLTLGLDLPPRWQASTSPSSQIQDLWWKSFNDPQLNTLISQALTYNHDLKAAAARVQTAQAEARGARSELFPTLGASFDGSRRQSVTDLSSLGIPGGGVNSNISNSFGVALNTSWELDLWGRIRNGSAASLADLEASEAEYVAKALSLAGQTAKAWFSLTEARQQLALAQRTRDTFKKTSKQATDRVDAGIQSPTDKHLAASNLASSEALVEQRREAVKRTSRQLEVLVGRYPSGNTTTSTTLPNVPRQPPAGLPSTLIKRRPDLIAAERRLAASIKRTSVAKASLYPQLSLTASAGRSSTEFENLTNGDFSVWSIAGNLVQPIFQGGRLRANVQSAKGRQREASENFAQLALGAYGEVETALAVDQVLARRESRLKESAEAAGKAATVSNNRYDQGIETLLTILESQRRNLDAESALITARRARLDNRIDLHLALGGGFKMLSRQR